MNLAEEFIKLQSWAVVGASQGPEKFGNIIPLRLMAAGKNVFLVNPKPGQINSQPFYPNLESLPEVPDIVDVVVPPAIALQVVEECARLGIERIWFQPGTRSPEAFMRCRELGIEAVDDSCVLVELDKLGL